MSEVKLPQVKNLTCCCCGNYTKGRQWWNRDSGYGLCVDCIDYCHRGITDKEFESCYGIRGVHFDVEVNGGS